MFHNSAGSKEFVERIQENRVKIFNLQPGFELCCFRYLREVVFLQQVFVSSHLRKMFSQQLFIQMVFTVTSSNCKVKIEDKQKINLCTSFEDSLRKYSNLNFRVFTVRDTKVGICCPFEKSLPLDFQQLNHFKY